MIRELRKHNARPFGCEAVRANSLKPSHLCLWFFVELGLSPNHKPEVVRAPKRACQRVCPGDLQVGEQMIDNTSSEFEGINAMGKTNLLGGITMTAVPVRLWRGLVCFVESAARVDTPRGRPGVNEREETKEQPQQGISEDVRRARRKRALSFLQDVLFVELEKGTFWGLTKEEQEELLLTQLLECKQQHPGLGSDFDVYHAWIEAFAYVSRNDIALAEGRPALPDAGRFEQALSLMDELDLGYISRRLTEEMETGE